MEFFATLALFMLNMTLTVGLALGALILLRPLLVRILRPQQRVVLWTVVWFISYLPSTFGLAQHLRVLPVTFFDLVVSRSGSANSWPAFLPNAYDIDGLYNLALPGGALIPVELKGWVLAALCVVWFVGVAALCWHDFVSSAALKRKGKAGVPMDEDDPVLWEESHRVNTTVGVYLCSRLPTSYVVRYGIMNDTWYSIYLQDDLPREQMHLVLRHEFKHIELKHCFFKFFATVSTTLNWWNPVVWLGYRYFCRDMELACDEGVLKELGEHDRKEYAKTLVELGSGRQLWEAPMSFGECDAALRVKAAVAWKPNGWQKNAAMWLVTALAAVFFLGGPTGLQRREDMTLYYRRQAAADPAGLTETAKRVAAWHGASIPVEVEEIWVQPAGDSSGSLYVRTEDGWYRGTIFWRGTKGMVLNGSGEALDAPPDLTGGARLN